MAEQRNTNNITLANMQDATPEGKYHTTVFPNLTENTQFGKHTRTLDLSILDFQ